MVGNAIMMKQASICPKSSQYFEDLLTEAGLPKGVYQNIYLDSSHAEEVLKDFRVKGFSRTGSEGAGASVATSSTSMSSALRLPFPFASAFKAFFFCALSTEVILKE